MGTKLVSTVKTVVGHVIDCDADPFIPLTRLRATEHCKGGQLKWNPARVDLFFSKRQMDGGITTGGQLRADLSGEFLLNANVLDYLLAHLDLIPEEWKKYCVYFLGTEYRDENELVWVRCLCFLNGCWEESYDCLREKKWDCLMPVAVLRAD